MASQCSSSSSSRQDHPVRKTPGTSKPKAFPSIDDFINSCFTENLLKPQLPHLNKPSQVCSQSNSDGEIPSRDRSENRHRSRIRNKTEAKKLNEITKEMDKMLSRVKTKRQTNDFLQLFKNTLNNFIVPEHPMENNNNNANFKSDLKKDTHVSFPTTSTYRQHHYHVQTSQEINEIHPSEQNLFSNHETSVTVTSTLTRCKIKEPRTNVSESSKTNVLHRCYGKPSVKATSQIHKSRKKNNYTVTNCQRPQLVKSKNQKSPKQQVINQQMKTIYENEQYDKSENVEDMNGLVISDSKSRSSVESDKISVIENQISNEVYNQTSENLMQNSSSTSKTTQTGKWLSELEFVNEQTEPEETSGETKNQQTAITKLNSEQDNSMVQRLTSFWNKKLNSVEQKQSITDQSITTSLTSVLEEENENENRKYITQNENHTIKLIDKDDLERSFENNELKLVREERVTNSNKLLEISFSGNKTKNNGCKQLPQNVELPKLKSGLMNELLTVLRSRDNVAVKNKNNKDQVKQKINYEQNNTHSELICSFNAHSRTDSRSDNNSAVKDDMFSNAEQCDEKTFEEIQKCLLENMANGRLNKNESYIKNQSGISEEKPALNIIKINKFSGNYDDGDTQGTNEIKDNEKNYLTNIIENNYDRTNYDLNDHCAVITNVNSIIQNLKELIHIIESIPDELKSVDMNLNCLPIPDKIKRKISSLIVTPNIKSEHSKLSITTSTDAMDTQFKLLITPDEKNQLFRCSSSGKLLGYSKKEGYVYMMYFPRTLTKPIMEKIANPIQRIFFPKRNEYFKSKGNKFYKNQFKKINFLDVPNRKINTKGKDNQDKIEDEKAHLIRLIKHESGINDEKHDFVEKNLQLNNETTDEEAEIEDGCVTAITKVKARSDQPSIFFVTPPPNVIVTQLVSSNQPKDECYQKLKKGLLNKPFETTAVYSNKNLQNTKSNIKFDEHFLIETNSNNNSFEELSDGISVISCTLSNSNQPEEFNVFTTNDINNTDKDNDDRSPDESDTFREEIKINLNENRHALPNDLVLSNRRNNLRRRRHRLQNHLDDDHSILNGGSGDSMNNCGDVNVLTTIPCHQTSSMSVIVSNSINDSNSQPDINIVDSECNLFRSRSNAQYNIIPRSTPSQDIDNFSTCGVIQEEQSDEQLSEIDDFFMIERHTSKKEMNKTGCDTASMTSILSQNTNLTNNHVQSEERITTATVTDDESSNNNKLFFDNQFTFQNLQNKITEETINVKQNLSNEAEPNLHLLEDKKIDNNENDKKLENKDGYENDSYEDYCNKSVITEENNEESNKIITSQSETELPVTSFLSENIRTTSRINIRNLSHLNLSINYINRNSDIGSDINEDINCNEKLLNISSINIEDESLEIDPNKARRSNSIINKNNFHQSFHALYFGSDISNDGQQAITNKIIISNCKNNLDIMLENDPDLKKELLKIININNLCDKEKQLIAACIYLIDYKYCDKQSTFLNTSKHNSNLTTGMNTLWDKTSQTMFITIGLAKKSLMPYDFETETSLYRRRCKKLYKAFYTLFVSLVLVCMIQKHIFGILLPVSFPW